MRTKLSLLLLSLTGAALTACNSGAGNPAANNSANSIESIPVESVLNVTIANHSGNKSLQAGSDADIGVAVTADKRLFWYQDGKFWATVWHFADKPTGVWYNGTSVYVTTEGKELKKCDVDAANHLDCKTIDTFQDIPFSPKFDKYGNGFVRTLDRSTLERKFSQIRLFAYVNNKYIERVEDLKFDGVELALSAKLSLQPDGSLIGISPAADDQGNSLIKRCYNMGNYNYSNCSLIKAVSPDPYDLRTHMNGRDKISIEYVNVVNHKVRLLRYFSPVADYGYGNTYQFLETNDSAQQIDNFASHMFERHFFIAQDSSFSASSAGDATYVTWNGEKSAIKKCNGDTVPTCSTFDTTASEFIAVSFFNRFDN